MLAGSEMRAELNASTNKICQPRRERLIASGTVVKIATAEDLYRFTVSVEFRSASVAAKIVPGAHVSAGHWKPLACPVSLSPDTAEVTASPRRRNHEPPSSLRHLTPHAALDLLAHPAGRRLRCCRDRRDDRGTRRHSAATEMPKPQ